MTRPAFRGRVTAAGFVLDTPLIGEAEARQRVLDWWGDGARVHTLPTGAWLLVLTTPVSVLAERAPGLPLIEGDGGLVAPGFPAERDTVGVPVAGAMRHHEIAGLPLIDLAEWVDITEVLVHRLSPADVPPAVPVQPHEAIPQELDLRKVAKVGRRSAKMDQLLKPGSAAGRKALTVALVLVVGAVVVAAIARGSLIAAVAIAGLIIGALNARGNASASGAAHPVARPMRQGKGWLARLAFRTPFGSFLLGRHEQYLRRLTELFERRQWESALREAIAVGGDRDGPLGLGVPRRRTSPLLPSTFDQPGGRSAPYGPGMAAHLRELYRTAADALERDGNIEQAAFVLADLLSDPAAAVNLLERNGRLRMAAELAEGRELDPELVVRLWWRAGDRERAVDVARVRGAFAAAIDLLSRVDPAAASELRAAWVQDRQLAGDHIGAVAAAWPAPGLRHAVLPDIQSGMALGGVTSAHLFAYLLAQWPNDNTQQAALTLMDSADVSLMPQRAEFVGTLAGLTIRDKGVDRMITTAAVRAAARDVPVDQKLLRQLTERADPLMAADLPAIRAKPVSGELVLTAPAAPGQTMIHDAVAAGGGAILVAQGELGVSLLTLDGRARARWRVPAHQLVVADHGGSALLVGKYGQVCDIHRLDLATRQVRHWTSIKVEMLLPSFDGSVVVAVDNDGLAFFDVHSPQPRIVWRELDRDTVVGWVRRSPTSLAAFVRVQGRLELWRWELPGLTLRGRVAVGQPDFDNPLLASGFFRHGLGPADEHTVSADLLVFDGHVYSAHEPKPLLKAVFPHDEQLSLRSHAETVTLWDSHGRLVAADLARRQAITSLSL